MTDWRKLVEENRYAEAEREIEAALAAMKTGNEIEDAAWFYERWGDHVFDKVEKKRLYAESLRNFQIFASWSTSGGEGTARILGVNRVLEKIERLDEK